MELLATEEKHQVGQQQDPGNNEPLAMAWPA